MRRRDPSALDDAGRIDQIPPQNLEAEAGLIGQLLADREMFVHVPARLAAGAFYDYRLQAIYSAILAVNDAGDPWHNKIAVAEELKRRGQLEHAGGIEYLALLQDGSIASSEMTRYFARIVREKAALRQLITTGADIRRLGYEGEDDVDAALADAYSKVEAIYERFKGAELRPYTLAEIAERRREQLMSGPTFLNQTFWPEFNAMTGGLGPGLHVVSAAGGMGKTLWANQNVMWDANNNGPVLMWPTERGDIETRDVMISVLAGVPLLKQNRGLLTAQDHERLAAATLTFDAMPIEMYPSEPKVTSRQICIEVERLLASRTQRFCSIVIDVVGELSDVLGHNGAAKEEPSKHNRQTNALKRFRDLAKRQRIPVIALMHQNRDVGEKRPTQYTIRDGGDVEGTASNIILLWRDDPKKKPESGFLILDKSRDGREGVLPYRFTRGLWLEESQPRAWFETPPWEQPALDAEPPIEGMTEDEMFRGIEDAFGAR